MNVSIKDVAELAGVSTATVSHVINGSIQVKDETKQKVLDAVEKLDYHPNFIARSLRSQKSQTVALVMPFLVTTSGDAFFTRMAKGVEYALNQEGYHLLLSSSENDPIREQKAVTDLSRRMIDGLILVPSIGDHSFLTTDNRHDFPIVIADRKLDGFKGDCVLTESYEGSIEAVEVFIRKGHTKIGYLAEYAYELSNHGERLSGYRAALKKHGISKNDTLIRTKVSQDLIGFGYETVEQLVRGKKITALLINDISITVGVLKYCRENNVRIPEDLALITFDDYEWKLITDPPLSVVCQPAFELGKKAAEVLLERIKKPKKRYKEYRLPVELVLRESV